MIPRDVATDEVTSNGESRVHFFSGPDSARKSLKHTPNLRGFRPYVDLVENAARSAVEVGVPPETRGLVAAMLDGQPGRALRAAVPIGVRRDMGAFFTGAGLANRLVYRYARGASETTRLYDAACGAGDLLLACARYLPLGGSLEHTLSLWGQQLYGRDLYPEFVRITRARLLLTALRRHGASPGTPEVEDLATIFPHIQCGDAFKDLNPFQKATHLTLNPPFGKSDVPDNCEWGTGMMSRAAAFLAECVARVSPGTRIAAILPDVLRSGPLYHSWRLHIERQATVHRVTIVGAFDAHADVDVFVVRLRTRPGAGPGAGQWWTAAPAIKNTLKDMCDIHVGPVVPHRAPRTGPYVPFVYARLLPQWGQFSTSAAPRRRYSGRLFQPPLVVVRRTSAPADRKRAVATMIIGDRPVAIENHLLVLDPRRKSKAECRRLLRVLKSERTDAWLNSRVRCRHLTVAAVRGVPFETSDGND